MPFCPNCGASVSAAFCAKCGAKTSSGLGPSSTTDLGDNVAGALCYLGFAVTAIIFLLLPPYSTRKSVRFHAFQSLLITGAWIILNILFALVLPFIIHGAAASLVQLAGMLLWLFLMWKTYNNERIVLPVIGPIAEKQA
jgi:uncharacterized membrane protein